MRRILLADDSPQALRMAEQILTRPGVEVVSVTDGDVVMRRLADVNPELLILDVYLTGHDAFALARAIRALPEHRQLPIIFAAAPADKFEEQDARNAGADVILRKPFEASILTAAVDRLLEQGNKIRAVGGDNGQALDRSSIRAAVTMALDRAMPQLIDELTERVSVALARQTRR